MTGTLGNAGKTTRALRVIYLGQIVFHRNRAVRARLCAYTARNTTYLAHARNLFTAALRRTSNEYGRGGGDTVDYAFGAGRNARPARNAPVGVNLRKSARNFNRIFGANRFTVAAT